MEDVPSDNDMKDEMGARPWEMVPIGIQPFYPEIITIVDADQMTEICIKDEEGDASAKAATLLYLLNGRDGVGEAYIQN